MTVSVEDRLRRKYAKQPRQSPFGHWVAARLACYGDRWVENDLGKSMRDDIEKELDR